MLNRNDFTVRVWIDDVQVCPVPVNASVDPASGIPQSITRRAADAPKPPGNAGPPPSKPPPPPFDIFYNAVIEYGVNQSATCMLYLIDSGYSYLEKNFFRKTYTRIPVSVQFGWGEDELSDKINLYVIGHRVLFNLSTTKYMIQLGDIAAAQYQFELNTRSWPQGTRASHIVREIADDRLLKYHDTNQDIDTIEETRRLVVPIIQDNMPDMTFLAQEVKPLAVSSAKTGFANYNLYIAPDGVLHFHTCEYGTNVTFREYVVGGVGNSSPEVLSFSAIDNNAGVHLAGGRRLKVRGVDGITKSPIEYLLDDEGWPGRVEPDEMVYSTDYHPANRGHSDFMNKKVDLASLSAEEMELWARARWYNSISKMVIANLRITGDPYIYPDDLINIWIPIGDSSDFHYMSGTYHVEKVSHRIGANYGFTTNLVLAKKGVIMEGMASSQPHADVKALVADRNNPPRRRNVLRAAHANT